MSTWFAEVLTFRSDWNQVYEVDSESWARAWGKSCEQSEWSIRSPKKIRGIADLAEEFLWTRKRKIRAVT